MGKIGYRPSSTDIYYGIGKRIDDLCCESNISYSELAEKIGVDKRTVRWIMSGKDCRLSNIVRIADVFNVSLDYLVGRSDKR